MDETHIIQLCQAGETSEFTALYDAYNEPIYRFIYFRVHHKETAEDITSTVFMKALENIHQFQSHKGTFGSWLYRIARNTIIDHYRQHKTTEDILNVFDLADATNIPRDFDNREQLGKAWQYIQDLNPLQRDIVIMRVWSGLSHREIAEILSMTESSVKMSFSRTMSKLNIELAIAIIVANIFLLG